MVQDITILWKGFYMESKRVLPGTKMVYSKGYPMVPNVFRKGNMLYKEKRNVSDIAYSLGILYAIHS